MTEPTNPFGAGNAPPRADPASSHFSYIPTNVPQPVLRRQPFKTSNRILDDMRLTPALIRHRHATQTAEAGQSGPAAVSLLNGRPFEYKNLVAATLGGSQANALVLNNAVAYAPSVARVEHSDSAVIVTSIRGLISEPSGVSHFRVQVLEASPSRQNVLVDKHQYHVVARDAVSVDDMCYLDDSAVAAPNLLDDAFFKSLNCPTNHMVRVSVYSGEFSPEDLHALTDAETVAQRYAAAKAGGRDAEKEGEKTEKADEYTPLECFHTLLRVLKGPLLLPEDAEIQTINRTKTRLDAKIDVRLLDKLGFSMDEASDSYVPPNLAHNKSLRERYIRTAHELLYRGKCLKSKKQNDFDVTYSFSDTLSQVYTILSEVDKHASLTTAKADSSNRYPDFVALSAYSFYQEELLIRCYENSVNSDPHNKIHYVDCFKNIISRRSYGNSNKLQTYYNNQHMRGNMYGMSDYRGALKALGLYDVPLDTDLDQDVILEMYKSSIRSDPKNYTYLNKQLRTIATLQDNPQIRDFLATELIPEAIALAELRVEDVTEDEVVVTAFEYRLDEVMQSVNFNVKSPEIVFLQKCLLSLAVSRRSYILMTYTETHMPELSAMTETYSISDCMELLDIEDSNNDFDIISKFQIKLMQSENVDVRNLRAALRTIATEKNSDILFSFLRDGTIDTSLLPAENWPAGLDNIGNTCYLNSLLQFYFSIKPLRDIVLQFDENNVDLTKLANRKIGGRSVERSEVNRSFQFLYRLKELFEEMISTQKRYISPSKDLAYLSFLPLSQAVDFKDKEEESEMDLDPIETPEPAEQSPDLIEIDSPSDEKVTNTHVEEVQKPAKIMSIGADQLESAIEIGRQQDVTECIENVTFQIETALEPEKLDDDGEQYDIVKSLFCGKTKQTITPLDGSESRTHVERFYSLIVNVGDHPKDIYDALDNYFSEGIVSLEEGKVKRSLTISETPEILQFHVQRVLFDRERLMAYKSLEVIPFGEQIYIDRYLDTEDEEILAKRKEVFEWKSEMAKLHEEKQTLLQADQETGFSPVDSLTATVKYLRNRVVESEDLHISTETIDALENQANVLRMRIQAIDTRLGNLQGKVSGQFASYKKFGYSLFAVFIHRGEASYGHYWVYIKDPKRNIYRKYNDDTVTEVAAADIFNFSDTNTATPYYMVYVKEELRDQYIEPLKREIQY